MENNSQLSTVDSQLPKGDGLSLPKSWEIKKLGEVLSIERGGSPRPISKYLTNSPNGLNWIKIADATASDKYIYKTKQKITREGLHKTRMVNEGDFLLSNSMSFGRPYIMKTTGCIHDGWLVLKQNGRKIFHTDFLYFLLSSPFVFDQFNNLAAGSTVRNLNIALVSSVTVPVPPLPEQQRIVEILDKAFCSIENAKLKIENNLKNAKEVFQSKLQSIFDNGKLKVENGEWEEKTLVEVCSDIFAGGDKPKENFSKNPTESYNIPIFANAVKAKGLYGYTNIARVMKPSITISARGSGTGHTELRNVSFYPIVRLIVIIPDNELIDLYFLKYSIDNFDILRSGSAIPQLTVPMIKEYKVYFPLLEKQQKIIKKLNQLQTQTKKLETLYQQKLDNLAELKKSILQKAFRGEL